MANEVKTLREKEGKKTWKFWLAFWFIAAILLFSWYVFLQIRNKNIQNLKSLTSFLPVGSERRNELTVLADIYDKAGGFDREQTFLILFQNDMELRPGGGFIGSFGILKAKNGKVGDIQIHDTGVFDGRVPDTEQPPYPMAEMLHIKSWQMRDSNWSPDFRVNAEKAEYFYKLGQGGENFDGVIAINTKVLNSILEITGPVKIADYPGEYNDETAILQLEYQVEKGYQEQGIMKGERKSVMKDMAKVLIEKIHNLNVSQQLELAKKIEENLKQKNIQMFFKDESLQAEAEEINWAGRVKNYKGDYLMVVDANLNSLKSDLCIKREIKYEVDLSAEKPQAELALTYDHTCRTRDWMTANYNDWLRVYIPDGSWLADSSVPQENLRFGNDLGKKVVGVPVYVEIGKKETITLKYDLPAELKNNNYSLFIQKQSGSGEVPVSISVKKADGSVSEINEVLLEDKMFSF
ncbi:MAG: DUF4012 domain-containing protein [Candidatus Moranbacteria bacterium]|nr:DUF4012 domain-containing protein [Candidatus Moranbacteria bacterium]